MAGIAFFGCLMVGHRDGGSLGQRPIGLNDEAHGFGQV